MKLIDKDSLIEHMRKAHEGNEKYGFKWDLVSTVAVIGAEEESEIPSHAHWIARNRSDYDNFYVCSECDMGFWDISYPVDRVYRFCPNCGSYMDEVEE